MNEDLIFRDTCDIYAATVDEYGTQQLGEPTAVPCMFVQTTGYQHGASRDEINSTSRIAFPATHPFLTAHGYRLEEMIVQVNPFGNDGASQTFKITSVTPVRDLLLFNTVHHVECSLKKIEIGAYVS